MGGSAKIKAPKPTPTAQQQYASWLSAYPKLQGKLASAATADLNAVGSLSEGAASDNLVRAMAASNALEDRYGAAVEGETASNMRQLLADQIYGDLQSGSSLSDEQSRELEQYVRAAQVSRGITGGNAAIYEEAATKGSAGMELANSRRAAAQDFLSFNSATKPNALNAIMGMADSAYTGNAEIMQGAVAQNSAAAQQQQMLKYNAAAANAQSAAARKQGIGTMVGSIGGMAAGFALGGPLGMAAGGAAGGAVGGGVGGMF